VLRPQSYSASWGRAVFAVLLSVGWLAFLGPFGLHGGPATFANTTAVALFGVVAFGCAVVSRFWGAARKND
jgi:hypothetical protein